MPRCVACSAKVEAWTPLDHEAFRRSAFGDVIDPIGSELSRFWCPHCRATDRDRHLILYLDAVGASAGLASADVLHLAPEPPIAALVRRHGPRRYVRGDLQPKSADIERIDLEQLPFPAASFDYVICNHVLEHVSSVAQALAEVARVLRPGGRFVCQTPYARRLSTTFEDPALQTESDRVFFYGQNDHVRRFGRNLGDLIRSGGFRGALRAHAEVLGELDGEDFGVNEREPFFDFVREDAATVIAGAYAPQDSGGEAVRLARQILDLVDAESPPQAPATQAPIEGDRARYEVACAALATGDAAASNAAIAVLIDLAMQGTALAEVYCDLGDLAAGGGDHVAAVDLYRTAAALAEAPAPVLLRLARSLVANGQRDEALAAVGEALRHAPADADALHLARTVAAPDLNTLAWLRLVADLRHDAARLSPRLAECERILATIRELASAALPKDNA